jgi:serralysin
MANGTFVAASGTQNIDALLGGTKWNSLSVTYNFPADISYYRSDYGGQFPIVTNPASFQTATQAIRNTVSWAVQEQFMKVSNLTFAQAGSSAAADISIAGVDIPNFGGFGYFPVVPNANTTAADLQRQGDYWYDSPQTARFATIIRGDNSWRGVMHEIGHTLGLKHGNETGGVANTAMTADRDSMEFSVMTYRKYVGADPNGDSFADVEKFGAAQTR